VVHVTNKLTLDTRWFNTLFLKAKERG